jgi:hypothetical protein
MTAPLEQALDLYQREQTTVTAERGARAAALERSLVVRTVLIAVVTAALAASAGVLAPDGPPIW